MLSDASPVLLLSPWKPVFILFTFIAWGWMFSTHLDKDVRAVHLNAGKWNAIQMSCGAIALCIMLFGGMFYITYPIGLAIMITPILMYWKVRNEEVSEEYKFYIGADTIKASLAVRRAKKTRKQVTVQFDGAKGRVDIPEKEDASFEIYAATEEIISEALSNRATRLELQLTSKGCKIAYLSDGVPTLLDPISAGLGAKVIAFLKETAGTDPKDFRRKLVGSFEVSGGIPKARIDLTTSGSSHVNVLQLDFDREARVNMPWDALGLLPSQRDLFDQLKQEKRRHGIVLIGGNTQSGVTTTGYSILSQHDSYLCNIVTLEQEVFTTLEGITHHAAGDSDQDYTSQLQSIIRRDPEVILAADLKDEDAAKMAAKPGRDGPLIFISMSASSMKELVSKWATMVADPRQAFGALQAVVHQKLVRKLCENCRVPYQPSADLAKQGLPIDTVEQLYRQGGQVEHKNKVIECPICSGSGYLGQIGVFETMFLDNDTRKHLIAGDLKAAMAHARRNKCLTRLHEAAWLKVADGQTSIEEFGRVSSKKKSAKKKTTTTK